MKKALIILAVLVVSFTLSASTIDDLTYNLDKNTLSIVFPSVKASVYHLSSVMKNPAGADSLSKLLHGNASLGEGLNSLVVMFRDLGFGSDKVADVTAGFGCAVDNIAYAYDLSFKIDTYAEGSASLEKLKANPTLLSSLSFAYALNPFYIENLKIDVTAIGHVATLCVNDSITYETPFDKNKAYVSGNAGMGFPSDLRVKITFANPDLKLDVNVDNFLAFYFTKGYSNKSELKKSILAFGKNVIYQPMNINTKLSYDFHFNWFDLSLFAKLSNINDFLTKFSPNYIRNNSEVGVCFSIFDIAELETGIYNGYFGVSAGVNYRNNKIGFRYGWSDNNSFYGQAPADCLTIYTSFGWKE